MTQQDNEDLLGDRVGDIVSTGHTEWSDELVSVSIDYKSVLGATKMSNEQKRYTQYRARIKVMDRGMYKEIFTAPYLSKDAVMRNDIDLQRSAETLASVVGWQQREITYGEWADVL